MEYKQISLFSTDVEDSINSKPQEKSPKVSLSTSKRILEAFNVSEIPFFECDFDTLYPRLARIVPTETVLFDSWNLETIVACETVCAAVCHQMNWDYLRHAVLEKTQREMEWVTPEALSSITEDIVNHLFEKYNKPERIRAEERTIILRQVGILASDIGGFSNLFFDKKGNLLPEMQIRNNFLSCSVFSQDPEEKKLQLLFQKLSLYPPLAQLTQLCKPAVDYHLIRCYLRRGLIVPKNKFANDFIFESNINRVERKESTVGALRQLCAILMQRISLYTSLSINTVNQIEWHIGRSICTEGLPDCNLERISEEWIRSEFDQCPFYQNCCAAKYNHKLLYIEEPIYRGTSY